MEPISSYEYFKKKTVVFILFEKMIKLTHTTVDMPLSINSVALKPHEKYYKFIARSFCLKLFLQWTWTRKSEKCLASVSLSSNQWIRSTESYHG